VLIELLVKSNVFAGERPSGDMGDAGDFNSGENGDSGTMDASISAIPLDHAVEKTSARASCLPFTLSTVPSAFFT